jgi:hypothetical protein
VALWAPVAGLLTLLLTGPADLLARRDPTPN